MVICDRKRGTPSGGKKTPGKAGLTSPAKGMGVTTHRVFCQWSRVPLEWLARARRRLAGVKTAGFVSQSRTIPVFLSDGAISPRNAGDADQLGYWPVANHPSRHVTKMVSSPMRTANPPAGFGPEWFVQRLPVSGALSRVTGQAGCRPHPGTGVKSSGRIKLNDERGQSPYR